MKSKPSISNVLEEGFRDSSTHLRYLLYNDPRNITIIKNKKPEQMRIIFEAYASSTQV